MSGDDKCLLQIHAFRLDGELLPPTLKKYKIEFIGDSITSGEGAIGAKGEDDWVPMYFSALQNYAVMTADAMDAECGIISQSGWGVLSSWDNNPGCALPDYYKQICGLVSGDRNRFLGSSKEYNFAEWKADAVIVNLGTNDAGLFKMQSGMATYHWNAFSSI